jgi:hypothetical protein
MRKNLEMLPKIKRLVEKEFDVKDLGSPIRDQLHVDARTVYFILCQRNTKYSLSRTAKYVNRHHATAIHAYKIYQQWVDFPPPFVDNLKSLDRLDKIIQGGVEELSVEADLLEIYKKKNEILQEQIDSLLNRLEFQTKKLEEYRKKEDIY